MPKTKSPSLRDSLHDLTTEVYVRGNAASERIIGWTVYRVLEGSYRALHNTRLRRVVNPPLWFNPEDETSIEGQLEEFVSTYCSGVSLKLMNKMHETCSKNQAPEAQELAQLLKEQVSRNEATTKDYLRRYPVNMFYNMLFSAGVTLGSTRPEILAPLMGSSMFASLNAVHRYASVYDKMNTDLRDLNVNGLLAWRFFDLYQKGVIQNTDDQVIGLTADILTMSRNINYETEHRGTQLGGVMGALLSGDIRQAGVAIGTLATAHGLAWLATRGKNIGPWFMENDGIVRKTRAHAKRDTTRIRQYVEEIRTRTDSMQKQSMDIMFKEKYLKCL